MVNIFAGRPTITTELCYGASGRYFKHAKIEGKVSIKSGVVGGVVAVVTGGYRVGPVGAGD